MAGLELMPGDEVITPHGHGTILKHKPGNFRGQDYHVRLNTGREHWYAEKHIAFPDKVKQAA